MAKSQRLLRTALLWTIVVQTSLALLVLLRFSSTLFAQQEPGSVGLEPGMDRQGLDYRSFEIDGGPGACRDACASEARCQAYTWVRPGVQKPKAVCWLKDGVPSPTSNANCVSGVKWSLPQGLTGGLTYWIYDVVATIGSVDGIATMQWQGSGKESEGRSRDGQTCPMVIAVCGRTTASIIRSCSRPVVGSGPRRRIASCFRPGRPAASITPRTVRPTSRPAWAPAWAWTPVATPARRAGSLAATST